MILGPLFSPNHFMMVQNEPRCFVNDTDVWGEANIRSQWFNAKIQSLQIPMYLHLALLLMVT